MSNYEKNLALRQGHGIASEDGYFEARPQIDSMDAGRIKWLMWRVQDLEAKLAARAPADSVLEDAAREAIEKVLALFPFNALIQKFSVNNGPCLTADNDDEFYSVKRVLAFLTEIKTTLDAARKQGGA